MKNHVLGAASALAIMAAAPAAAQTTTVIDFADVPLGVFTSATFGAYRITNEPGYGSGTRIFVGDNGLRAIGDTIPEANTFGVGFRLTRIDGLAFNLDQLTFARVGNTTPGRIAVAPYGANQTLYTPATDGQVVNTSMSNYLGFFFDANTLNDANSASGISRLVVSANIAAVLEPATWGLMLAGFGLVGASVRARRVRFTGVAV